MQILYSYSPLSAAHTELLLRSSGNTRQSAAKPRSTLASASSPSLSKTTPSPTKVQPSRLQRPTTVTTPTKLSKTTGGAKHKTATQGTLLGLYSSLIPKPPCLIPRLLPVWLCNFHCFICQSLVGCRNPQELISHQIFTSNLQSCGMGHILITCCYRDQEANNCAHSWQGANTSCCNCLEG